MKNEAALDRRPLTLPLHAQSAAHGGLLSGCVSDANDQPHTTRAMVACTQPAGRKVMRWTMDDGRCAHNGQLDARGRGRRCRRSAGDGLAMPLISAWKRCLRTPIEQIGVSN
ncbi:hypothetical protein [Ottowia oryzae]|uniref:hypothetical protein n=1 Tax=Ottowia oryzae TaxID=2109914 RepID=UPI000F4D6C45|nr:hypothetical protein [Ottowia oryzae]